MHHLPGHQEEGMTTNTVKNLKIRIPEKFAVIILKFEQDGFSKE